MRRASSTLPAAASRCARSNEGPATPPASVRPVSYSARASSNRPSASSERARLLDGDDDEVDRLPAGVLCLVCCPASDELDVAAFPRRLCRLPVDHQ